jgi:hypothetical protein
MGCGMFVVVCVAVCDTVCVWLCVYKVYVYVYVRVYRVNIVDCQSDGLQCVCGRV